MTPERRESIAAAVGVFVLVEVIGAIIFGLATAADRPAHVEDIWKSVAIGATVTTLLAALCARNVYRDQREGEGYRFAERERARGVIDV